MFVDPHSFSKPHKAKVTHLRWTATVDFISKTINAVASWEIETMSGADEIVLDSKGLRIAEVRLDGDQNTTFRLSETDPLLGQALTIAIKPGIKAIQIHYRTSEGAEALQWLSPQQTSGKKLPFLFTQSQAILARSWIPCQDSPSVRFTYTAEVQVPNHLLALMSASNPQRKNESGLYEFEMEQPIPSYLLALAVGDMAFRPISDRSGVYAEPCQVDDATWEFADLEKMIVGAESLYGPYRWERYDVLVLPPSFPFGGMENPRITFATPTILAGDRSLTSLIAHELAHSWSGNLVTNATWNDFWLNEGFTVYFEQRIMEKLYGKDYSEMLAMLALQDLQETIKAFHADNLSADTKLKLNLEKRNPDEAVSDIAYNKGYFFLRSIEEKFGRDKFDAFLVDYFSDHAFAAMDTDHFIKYITSYYHTKFNIGLDDAHFNAWIFTEDLPAQVPHPVSKRFKAVETALHQWRDTGMVDETITVHWSTHEWLHFLKNLRLPLTLEQMEALDEVGHFTASSNAEITSVWLVHVIRSGYKKAYAKLEDFLIHTGRRKFLSPLYHQLIKTEEGKNLARKIYQKARPNYHFVATNTFDKLFK